MAYLGRGLPLAIGLNLIQDDLGQLESVVFTSTLIINGSKTVALKYFKTRNSNFDLINSTYLKIFRILSITSHPLGNVVVGKASSGMIENGNATKLD